MSWSWKVVRRVVWRVLKKKKKKYWEMCPSETSVFSWQIFEAIIPVMLTEAKVRTVRRLETWMEPGIFSANRWPKLTLTIGRKRAIREYRPEWEQASAHTARTHWTLPQTAGTNKRSASLSEKGFRWIRPTPCKASSARRIRNTWREQSRIKRKFNAAKNSTSEIKPWYTVP